MKITIHDELECEYISPIMYQCNIRDSSYFTNPKHLLTEDMSVIMIDSQGRTAIGTKAFTLKVPLNTDYVLASMDWLGANPLITAAIAVAIALSCLLCGYCCYRERRRALYGSYSGRNEQFD